MEKKNKAIGEYRIKNYLSIYRNNMDEQLVKYLECYCADGFLDQYYGMIVYPDTIKTDIQVGGQGKRMKRMLTELLEEAKKHNAFMILIWDI